jgi:hypothetical protein
MGRFCCKSKQWCDYSTLPVGQLLHGNGRHIPGEAHRPILGAGSNATANTLFLAFSLILLYYENHDKSTPGFTYD